MTHLLPSVWDTLGGAPEQLRRLTVSGPRATLASTFPVTDVGVAAVGASLLAATTEENVGLDTRQLAVALRSERYLLRDGRSPGRPFDPLSAFHRTADGWLRLHANYAWHRAAALRVLGCSEQDAPAAIADWKAVELETAVHEAGGVAAAVRTEEQWRAVAGPPPDLVERRVLGEAPARATRRPRVLDLTRVIAGPSPPGHWPLTAPRSCGSTHPTGRRPRCSTGRCCPASAARCSTSYSATRWRSSSRAPTSS